MSSASPLTAIFRSKRLNRPRMETAACGFGGTAGMAGAGAAGMAGGMAVGAPGCITGSGCRAGAGRPGCTIGPKLTFA